MNTNQVTQDKHSKLQKNEYLQVIKEAPLTTQIFITRKQMLIE